MMDEDSALILSSNGDVRGRKGLVKEIRRITIDSSKDEPINKRIDRDTLWAFDASKRKDNIDESSVTKTVITTKTFFQPSNVYELPAKKTTQESRYLAPVFEQNLSNETFVSSGRTSFSGSTNTDFREEEDIAWLQENKEKEDDQISTNFGYWEHKNLQNGSTNSYSINTKENSRVLQTPQLYTKEHGSEVNPNPTSKLITQWQTAPLNWDDVKPTFMAQSSRASSIRSYKKALPVGKFATQKFHILQDEEDFTENPRIYDAANCRITNLEKTCEFDCINESVMMDICDFKTANIEIKIEEVKYSRKNVTEKRWSMKKTEIRRSVNIDLFTSGQGKLVRSLIYDTMIHLDALPEFGISTYRVNVDEFELTGQAAFTIFNILMQIAEQDVSSYSGKTETYKNKFSPRYLLAILREEETIGFF